MSSTELEVRQTSGMMTLKSISDRVNMVHQVLEKIMVKETHYGTVPGCGKKMVLFKPGADLLAMTFRLVPQFKVEKMDMENGHREYDVTCTMYAADGSLLGQGVGSCSTMEKKYRYRSEGGTWDAAQGRKVGAKQIENEDIADVYNTVLKMAKKRAQIDATLTVTGAADMFTQDLIENEDDALKEPIKEPMPKKQDAPNAAPQDSALVVTGVVSDVNIKEGKTAGKPWVKYGVQIDGAWYGTFDSKIGESAEFLKGQSAEITYTTDGKYNTIVTIKAV